ncbi:MAG: hypothetical protein CMI53_05095 [Parcubacteria group bacterium]|jgi:ABC-type glycerol-3-phosphate transport system permease component|nr:hypothetical protein [Parcubacteria group bacterium]|tara:strand:- start:935 stop:1279 length:345 start_codon:yes stop_codon:yes gene_type:complete
MNKKSAIILILISAGVLIIGTLFWLIVDSSKPKNQIVDTPSIDICGDNICGSLEKLNQRFYCPLDCPNDQDDTDGPKNKPGLTSDLESPFGIQAFQSVELGDLSNAVDIGVKWN